MNKKYVGYKAKDYTTDYAKFYDETIVALPREVQKALDSSPLASGTLLPFEEASALKKAGYMPIETGYTTEADGAAHVAVLTHMPNVTPQMWDWWFAWHGCKDSRYKLWHPKAHLSAQWKDGKDDLAYIGRTSIIQEYIGKGLFPAAIQFKSPTEFGFSHQDLQQPEKEVYICARIGHPTLPVDYGYLIHQIRAVTGGSEMRSRFWMGGRYIALRNDTKIAKIAVNVLKKLRSLPNNFAHDLLIHCVEEMNHLATFLPDIFAQETVVRERLHITGTVIEQTNKDFEQIIMGTLFNKVDPGKRPAQVVLPKTIPDIQATIKYAKAQGKKITVCSGGHSFSANHLRDNSILLMMKHFDQYEINVQAMTAKAGPGVGGSALMQALYKHQLFFPAGHCKGVCIGGYLLQGGYGWNGRKLGIACQSIIGLDMVTASGEFLHANEQENADLFWAARGGGPGFFAIVTCFYLRLYPLPPYRATIAHAFHMKHIESVFHWAHQVGSNVPKAIEFQLLMSNSMLNLLGPGIEAFAPIFADTKDEFEEAIAFMNNSPIKQKALITTPPIDIGIKRQYQAVMTHYPEKRYWGVDNMWTHAAIDDLMPYLKEIARTLPPAPSHLLWLNWHPDPLQTDMAYSKEDDIYIALYANWKKDTDTEKYGYWAANMMQKMAHLSTGIQLADEGLHHRTASFLSDEHLQRIQTIRAKRDPDALFYEWHSKPDIVKLT